MKTILISLLIVFSCFAETYPQQRMADEDVIKVDTSLVVVPTKVTDRNNKNITNLKRENFRLFEDGVEQKIENFEDADVPFTIALALDVSDSTAAKLTKIKVAAIAFLAELRKNDRVLIFTFDNRLAKVADGTVADLSNIQNSIAFSQTGGGTSLYDATTTIITDYLAKIGGKKALILFTDGIDTQSVYQTSASSARLAEESDVLIYPIQYETVGDVLKPKTADLPFGASVQIVTVKGEPLPAAFKRGTLYLNSLANGTSGQFFYADTPENLSKSFARIAKELSQLYGLSYYPQNETANGKRRQIKVTVDVPKAIVRPRRSYIFNRSNSK
ncbi:MAG: VWA domain-containing protein [Pyrinomonadaceae bacterium]